MKTTLLFLAALAGRAIAPRAESPSEPAALRERVLELIQPLPERMPGAEYDTPARIRLGERLFFEKKLSQNQTQSCNSCHAVDQGGAGVDNQPTSPGAFGKRGDRNSPTVLNAGFHFAQFWDGRADDLAAQAKGPVLNPVEMAMPSEHEVIARLSGEGGYPEQFRQAFPDIPQPLTYENMAAAIAAFERTLITRDRFDEFLKGNDRRLSAQERKGLDSFLAMGCATCHQGPLLGGTSFQKLGLVRPYPHQDDRGRAAVTNDEDDAFRFKVPTLRNIAATRPYFHDGRVTELDDAVRQMGSLQLGLELTGEQVADITAFLRTLTGEGIRVPKPDSAAGAASPTGGN